MAEEQGYQKRQWTEDLAELGPRGGARVGVADRANPPESEEFQFDRLALFTGRPLYWSTGSVSSSQYAERVMQLFDWCVGLPGVQIGIQVRGLAQILKSMYSLAAGQIPQETAAAFERLLVQDGAPPVWDPRLDANHWGRYVPELTQLVVAAREPVEQVWLQPARVRWWRQATEASLKEYANYELDPASLLRLLGRHRCMLFAPLDAGALVDHVGALVTQHSPATQDPRLQTPDPFQAAREQVDDPRLQGSCWSWQFLEFGTVGKGNIILKPVLALWNDWPSNPRWAPQPRSPSHPAHLLFSSNEAAALLEDVYLRRLEAMFGVARLACGLGIASPDIAEFESRAPVFYFASPAHPPARPEEYVDEKARAIAPLVRTCLATRDALAREVAWGILEGRVVTLRHEAPGGTSNDLWYLLLPASATPTAEIEEALAIVVSQLGYLEVSIGDEAQDIYTDLETQKSQRALLDGTLDGVSGVIDSALQLLPTVSRWATTRITDMLPRLNNLFRRVGTVVEDLHNKSVQVQGQFDSYTDGTEDYLRRQVTFRTFPYPYAFSLLDAFKQAYPYDYLRQPARTHAQGADELQRRIQPISDTLDTLIEQANLQASEQLKRYAQIAGVAGGLLALVLAFPQFLSAFGLTSSLSPFNIASDLAGGIVVAALATIGALILVALISGLWLFVQHRVPPRQSKFMSDVKRFREFVDLSTIRVLEAGTQIAQAAALVGLTLAMREEPQVERSRAQTRINVRTIPRDLEERLDQLEQMDEDATQVLADLWKRLRTEQNDRAAGRLVKLVRRVRGQPVGPTAEWLKQARVLEYVVNLFDFAPEIILMPRALCIFRYKSEDFRTRTVVSDTNFRLSLLALGFNGEMVRVLDRWLTSQVNQERIKAMDVRTFAQRLKEYGVRANPTKRTPNLWQGPLGGTE